ncbi:hypothetical protein [Streptomyces sp. NPDC002763]|uniref:hypothetical protein n=1 Tax=Streptomyces sp. NPDC002763 TaxID=3154427 RepID=UPI003330E8E3
MTGTSRVRVARRPFRYRRRASLRRRSSVVEASIVRAAGTVDLIGRPLAGRAVGGVTDDTFA